MNARAADAGGGKLHRKLSPFGVLLLTLSCLSPVLSIYGVGGDVLKQTGTGAAGLFLLGIGAAFVLAVVYAELASAYPYAGGDYVGVGSILGPWAGFASLTIWAVILGPGIAFTAKIIATYVGDLAPSVPTTVVTFGSLAAAVAIALLAARTSAIVTGVFLAIEMLTVCVLISAGFWHPVRGLGEVIAHPLTLDAAGALGPVAIGSMALAAVSAAYGTCGGNQAIAFGEELHQPHRHMGNVILLAALIGALAIALPVIAVVLGASDLVSILNSPVPFSTYMMSIAGPAAGHAMSAAVALAVFNALIVAIMFAARFFFSLGRDAIFLPRINRMLASVHGTSGAPRTATLFIGLISAACCLLSSHLLLVFLSGSFPYILGLVSLAVLAGRPRRLTGQPGYWRSPLFPLAPILGLCLAAATAIATLFDADAGRPSILVLGCILLAALLWHRFVLARRPGGWIPRLE